MEYLVILLVFTIFLVGGFLFVGKGRKELFNEEDGEDRTDFAKREEKLDEPDKEKKLPEDVSLDIVYLIEAFLFAKGKLISKDYIMKSLSISSEDFDNAISFLKEFYNRRNGGVILREINGSFQFVVNPVYSDKLVNIFKIKRKKLTKAQREVLAIIAYKQPITVQEIEDIRGSYSRAYVLQLMKMGLVEIKGKREDVPGKPATYGTTDLFLEYLGINDLSELPDLNEFHF